MRLPADVEYDPTRGLFLPASAKQKVQAGPNPDRKPMDPDPVWVMKLNEIGRRVGRRYRFYWMQEMGIWGIQVHVAGDHWKTEFCNYDEETQWTGNMYPYRPIDERCLREFCESDLKIKYGTGDLAKDQALRDADIDAKEKAAKEKATKRRIELNEAIASGGDPTRYRRFIDHADMHHGPGVRFQEFHQVHPDTPVKEKVKP